MTALAINEAPRILRARSFVHKGRIYDVTARLMSPDSQTVAVEVTSNGHGIYYDYPDGVRTQQKHEVTFFGDIDTLHIATMSAVDFAMDDAERLVRAWVS